MESPVVFNSPKMLGDDGYVMEFRIDPNFKPVNGFGGIAWGQIVPSDMTLVAMESNLQGVGASFSCPTTRLRFLRNRVVVAEVRTVDNTIDYELVFVVADGPSFKAGDVFEVQLLEVLHVRESTEHYVLVFQKN